MNTGLVSENRDIATKWFDAFNRHDLDDLLLLYADDASHFSPKLKIRQPETQGLIKGKAALKAWWKEAFERLPELRYEVIELTSEQDRVFMEYNRFVPGEEQLRVAELLQIKNGKIIFSRVYHG